MEYAWMNSRKTKGDLDKSLQEIILRVIKEQF